MTRCCVFQSHVCVCVLSSSAPSSSPSSSSLSLSLCVCVCVRAPRSLACSQYGVFSPLKQFIPSKVALLITFVMSGVFHDYIWNVLFYRPHDDGDNTCPDSSGNCHIPVFGKLSAFFFYTGIIMLLERPLSKVQPFVGISNNLPTFAISTMLVIVHMPFAHW